MNSYFLLFLVSTSASVTLYTFGNYALNKIATGYSFIFSIISITTA